MTEKNAQRIANGLTFLLVIALGWLLAWWTWRLLAPHPRPQGLESAPVVQPSQGDARRLFGDATPAVAEAAPTSNVRLKGIYLEGGARAVSSAVVNLGAKDKAVRVGQEVGDGSKLAEIHPTHIVLNRAGVEERINLEKFRNTRVAVAATKNAEGFRLNVANAGSNQYRLSRQELNTVLQDPRQLDYLGRINPAPGGSGIRVDDAPPQSLSGKLGLKVGDIITAVNGQPVSSAGDLARIYQQFGTLTTIRADVKRDGVPISLRYAISN